MVFYVQITAENRFKTMHIFDYSFLKDDLLPAQLSLMPRTFQC